MCNISACHRVADPYMYVSGCSKHIIISVHLTKLIFKFSYSTGFKSADNKETIINSTTRNKELV